MTTVYMFGIWIVGCCFGWGMAIGYRVARSMCGVLDAKRDLLNVQRKTVAAELLRWHGIE